MPKTIISDTSCFIILNNIGELDLLHKVYGNITTTPDIAAEYGDPLPEWVKIIAVKDKYRQQLWEIQIDKPVLDKMKQTNFRLSAEIELQALKGQTSKQHLF